MLTLKADSSVCSPGGGEASVNTSDSRAGSDININKNIASLNKQGSISCFYSMQVTVISPDGK